MKIVFRIVATKIQNSYLCKDNFQLSTFNFIMAAYQIWLIVAIVLVIIELLTAGFGVICFAIGAAFSALVSGLV